MPPIKRTNLARYTNRVRRNQSARGSQTQEERVILKEASRVYLKQLREMVGSGLRNNGPESCCFQIWFHKDQRCVDIGSLSVIYPHCKAMNYKLESPDLYCAGGKVKLPVLTNSPEPLYSFLYGNTTESKYIFANIQKYNGCFRTTSFGAEVVDLPGYNPSFEVMAPHYYKLAILIFFQITCKHWRFKVKFTTKWRS